MDGLFIPPYATNLKNQSFPQIRLAIQGPAGTGKTESALTFPNVIVAALEQGLNVHVGKDIPVIPFYDPEFTNSWLDKKFIAKATHLPNVKAAFRHFMLNDALKLKPEQTLFIDSWSALQWYESYQTEQEPTKTKKGADNEFAAWQEKQDYAGEILHALYSCKCHIVISFHESQTRDKTTGRLLDKIAPLMQGGFGPQLKRFFPDFYRCIVEGEEERNTGIQTKPAKFYWQVRSDNKFDAKCTLNIPEGEYRVEPNFSIFEKYRKKII